MQYIVNEKGERVSVILDMTQWNAILQELKILESDDAPMSKSEILGSVKQAVKEINLIKAGKLKARPIKELLDEL